MAMIKKYGGWMLMGLGALVLVGWAYTKFGKGAKVGFEAPKDAA